MRNPRRPFIHRWVDESLIRENDLCCRIVRDWVEEQGSANAARQLYRMMTDRRAAIPCFTRKMIDSVFEPDGRRIPPPLEGF
jgi:hypothetical protein